MKFYTENRFKKLLLLIVYLFIIGTFCSAQTIGDFRSVSSGEWTDPLSWQVYDGTLWTASSTYPGQNAGSYAVEILAGHVVSTSGINTQPMGSVTINGILRLNGSNANVDFVLNTPLVYISQNFTPTENATISFNNKSTLKLPDNAVIKVWFGLNGAPWGGLSADCNNNQKIQIGVLQFAACNGAPGSMFTFAELMDAGGTLDAISTVKPLSCLGETVQLKGDYTGAIGEPVTYSWTSTGPAPLDFSPNSTAKEPTIKPTVAGTYYISLTVSTKKDVVVYSNTEKSALVVPPGSSTTNAAICQGDIYSFNGTDYTATGTYEALLESPTTGCDSTAILNLTVLEVIETIKDTICEGETYYLNGQPYTESKDTVILLTDEFGECSSVMLQLRIRAASPDAIYDEIICQGSSFDFYGSTYNIAGTYPVNLTSTLGLTNSVGCDSTAILNLTVNPTPILTNVSLAQTICSGESTTTVTLTSDVELTTFEWTASSDTGITGFTPNGTGPIPAETLTNPSNSTAGTVTYVIIPIANGCTGIAVNYVVTVTPKPITTEIYHQ